MVLLLVLYPPKHVVSKKCPNKVIRKKISAHPHWLTLFMHEGEGRGGERVLLGIEINLNFCPTPHSIDSLGFSYSTNYTISTRHFPVIPVRCHSVKPDSTQRVWENQQQNITGLRCQHFPVHMSTSEPCSQASQHSDYINAFTDIGGNRN